MANKFANVQPPNCDKNAHSFRKRRDLNKPGIAAALRTDEIKELSLEVYSGLHVNEADSEEECECAYFLLSHLHYQVDDQSTSFFVIALATWSFIEKLFNLLTSISNFNFFNY